MKYTKPRDVWALTDTQLKQLQIGQWVYAGDPSNKGVWLGMKPSGTKVVMWLGNARNRKETGGYRKYQQGLLQFARG